MIGSRPGAAEIPGRATCCYNADIRRKTQKEYRLHGCPIYFVLRKTGQGYTGDFYADRVLIDTFPEKPIANRSTCLELCRTYGAVMYDPANLL